MKSYYSWQGKTCKWLVFPGLNKAIPMLGIRLNPDAYARMREEDSIKEDERNALDTIHSRQS